MEKISINKEQLMPYIMGAFVGDDEIVSYYDKARMISSIMGACQDIHKKITQEYNDCVLVGIEEDNRKLGYFAYSPDRAYLVSFGINKSYRVLESLKEFWGFIKSDIGDTFQCMLFSHNKRAISWLEKCGMDILFENITILTFSQN